MVKKAILKKLTKEQAAAIISKSKYLTRDYEAFVDDYEYGDVDSGFGQGNFFTLDEDKTKIVIQWLDDNYTAYEIVVDSLEECIVRLKEIEDCEGNVDLDKSEIVIDSYKMD